MRSDRHFGGHASPNNGTNCRRSAIYATIGIIGGLILIIAIVLPTGLTLGLTTEAKAGCTKDYECISQNPCIESRCTEGLCEHIDIKNCCVKDQDCGGDVCYKNYCDPKSFTCKLYPPVNGTVCDDYNMCTLNDMCDGYTCKGTPNLCQTDNICSFGQCKEGVGCVFSSVQDGTQCYTNDKCYTTNTCQNGICTLGAVKDCSYLDSTCSQGVCDSNSGECVRVNINERGACDDGLECTLQDQCLNGYCIGEQNQCYDNNPCTINKCIEGIGCMLKYENYNRTCSATCLTTDDCPTDDNWICADGTCVIMDYSGSQIRFIDYEIEVCPAGGHRLVMDFVLDSNVLHVGNDTRYIIPRTLDDIGTNHRVLGFIAEKRSLQTMIISQDIVRSAFTLTTHCQEVTAENCDTMFSMRRYQFFVEMYHCLSVAPNEPNCIDTNMAVSASIDLSISDCSLFDSYQHIPLLGTAVLYSHGIRYQGIIEDPVVSHNTEQIIVGFESDVYHNDQFITMVTNLRLCTPNVDHYLKDCVSGKDPKCIVTGCYNWDPNDSPIDEYHDIVVDSVVTALSKTTWGAVGCYDEDNYNAPSSTKCAQTKCPQTPNGIVSNFPTMDDGFILNTVPLRTQGMVKEWTVDIEFKMYYCGNHTRLRSSDSVYHNILSLLL